MFRNAILATVLAVGVGAVAPAEPPIQPPPVPVPAPNPSGIEGRWFMSGDPFKPCYIQGVPGPGGPTFLLTNEKGEQSRGRLLLNGQRIIADDWANGLVGDVYGNSIVWRNGTDWVR